MRLPEDSCLEVWPRIAEAHARASMSCKGTAKIAVAEPDSHGAGMSFRSKSKQVAPPGEKQRQIVFSSGAARWA